MATIRDARTRRASSWDRSGGNADFVSDLVPGATATLLDVDGPGRITHLWFTVADYHGHATVMRDAVLRITWDGAAAPSVEAPLGDFFGVGHALPPSFYRQQRFALASSPICVGRNERALNCWWPMPFRRHARVEVVNRGEHTLKQLYFHVDHEIGPQDADCGLFHAEFRQQETVTSQPWVNLDGRGNYVVLDAVGRGHYVGCFLYVDQRTDGWYGEGDDMIFVDGDEQPTINGTGTEDYFLNAWGFDEPYSYPWYGCPLLAKRAGGGVFFTLYRFHGEDPIRFRRSLRVTFETVWGQHLEAPEGGPGENGFASVAFWYQDGPAAARPLPPGRSPLPRLHPEHAVPAPEANFLPAMEVALRRRGIACEPVFVIGQEFMYGGALRVRSAGTPIDLEVAVPAPGAYRVALRALPARCDAGARAGIAGGELRPLPATTPRFQRDAPLVELGTVVAHDGVVRVRVVGDGWVALQDLRVEPILSTA